jgi:hypothetical protein
MKERPRIQRCRNLAELTDFIASVVLRAPDNFLKANYLRSDEQLNLDSAFDEIRQGLERNANEIGDQRIVDWCYATLQESYQLYSEGKIKEGAWKLQEILHLFMARRSH